MTREQGGDPVVEGGLGQGARRRQETEDGPLDPVREGRGRRFLVARLREPPASWLDLGEPTLIRPRELLADEADQTLDRIGRGVGDAREASGRDRWTGSALGELGSRANRWPVRGRCRRRRGTRVDGRRIARAGSGGQAAEMAG